MIMVHLPPFDGGGHVMGTVDLHHSGMCSIILDIVDEVPGREADAAPTPAHQIHRHDHLLQPIHKNHLPLQSDSSSLLHLHATDMMFLAGAAAIANRDSDDVKFGTRCN